MTIRNPLFNPLVKDLSKVPTTDIDDKIIDLQRKYWQAASNPTLQMQVHNLLDMYIAEQHDRNAKSMQQEFAQNKELDNLIKVN